MVPHLQTQLVEDSPRILVVSEHAPSIRLLKELLDPQGLDVLGAASSTLHGLATDQPTEFYKVVWFITPETTVEQVNQVLAWLETRTEPLVVITTCLSPIVDDRTVFEPWVKQTTHEAQVLEVLRQSFTDATLLIGRDVIVSPTSFTPYQVITHYLANHTLVDPEITLTLQTNQGFFQAIVPNIVSPLPHQLLVEGRGHSSTDIVRKIQLTYQRQTGVTPVIESLAATPLSLPDLPQTTNPQLEPVTTLTEAMVAAWPLPKRRTVVAEPSDFEVPLPQMRPVPTTSTRKHRSVSRLNRPPAKVSLPTEPLSSVGLTPETTSLASQVVPVRPPHSTPTITSEVSVSPEIELETQVADLFQKYRADHTVERVQKLAKTTQKVSKKQTHKKKLFWAGLAFVGVGLGVVALGVLFWLSSWGLQRSLIKQLADQSTTASLKAQTNRPMVWLAKLVEAQVASYSLVLDEQLLETQAALAEAGLIVSQVSTEQQTYAQSVTSATMLLLGRGLGDSLAQWSQAGVQAQALYDRLSDIQAVVKRLSKVLVDPARLERLTVYETWLAEQKKALLPGQQLQPLLPVLLGETTPRTYVVLFQNNQELRPTGGFIQSLAVVTVDQGIITDTQVLNAYDVDKNILGVVAPPAEITRYLGEQQWYFRDSNWNPDFPTTSNQVAWYVERSIGKKVDGVIGLNLIAIRDLLKVLGPLDVPEYNEVLTDRNLQERMEFHSEIQLVPNPNQPDYSTLVLNKLMTKLTQMPEDKVIPVLSALGAELSQNQVQVSLTSSDENSSLTSLGWTGSLLRPACPTQLSATTCMVDVVAQVEANVGVNKANAYITRKTHHVVSLSPTQVRHRRTMSFTNTATTPAWPKGPYKNYLRLYVAPEAQLHSLSINNSPVPAEQITMAIENKRKVIGVLVEVPVNQTVEVVAEYHLSSPPQSSFAYALFDQRQSGIEDLGLTVEFTHDAQLKPTLIAPQAQVKDNQITFEPATSAHTFVGAQFN